MYCKCVHVLYYSPPVVLEDLLSRRPNFPLYKQIMSWCGKIITRPRRLLTRPALLGHILSLERYDVTLCTDNRRKFCKIFPSQPGNKLWCNVTQLQMPNPKPRFCTQRYNMVIERRRRKTPREVWVPPPPPRNLITLKCHLLFLRIIKRPTFGRLPVLNDSHDMSICTFNIQHNDENWWFTILFQNPISEPYFIFQIWNTIFTLSYYSDTADYNEKCVASSGIRTRIFGFQDRPSTHWAIESTRNDSLSWKTRMQCFNSISEPSSWYEKLVSHFHIILTLTAENNEQFVVSCEIQTRIFWFLI